MEMEKSYYVEDFIMKYIYAVCTHCGIEQTYQMYTVEDDTVYCHRCRRKMETKLV